MTETGGAGMVGARLIDMSKVQPWKWSSAVAFLLVLLSMVAAASFWAGKRAGTSIGVGGQVPHVSIEARDADVRDVLQSFAKQIGAQLALESSIKGKISIKAENSNLHEVMNDLCTVYQCQWSLSTDTELLTVTKLSSE